MENITDKQMNILRDMPLKIPKLATGHYLPTGLDAAIAGIDERKRMEAENEKNLRISADNSNEILNKLQTQINQKDEDLNNQRELIHMLKQQLIGISRTLSDLFIIEEGNQELHEEANKLAREIYASMIQNKKVDWKAVLMEKGPDVLLTAIPIILQLTKVI